MVITISDIIKLCRKKKFSFCGDDLKLFFKGELHCNAKHLYEFFQQEDVFFGKVCPTMKDAAYDVEIAFKNGKIFGQCSCVVGKYKCSHMVTLLLYIHKNVSSTDIVCQWKEQKPAKEGKPIAEIYEEPDYKALKRDVSSNDIDGFIKSLPDCRLKWIFSNDDVENDALEGFYLFNLSSMSLEELLIKCRLNETSIAYIEENTRGQASNPKWQSIRINRLTASNFGYVINAVKRQKFPPSLFSRIKGSYKLDGVKAIQWGRENEAEGIKDFQRITGKKVKECGIYMHTSGLIGASPDGVIGEDKLVEVKCPYKYRQMSQIDEALEDPNFYLIKKKNKYILKSDHAYYHQIQGQLFLSNRVMAYLVVKIPNDCVIVELEKDSSWAANIPILIDFVKNKYFPTIFDFDTFNVDIDA